MSSKGWIRLDRKIMDNFLWSDKPFSMGQAWIDLLLLANAQERQVLIGNEVVDVKPGTIITSETKLSERWGWGRTKTRTFLKTLKNVQMIEHKTYTKRTEINIVNWGIYQNSQTQNKQKTYSKPNINQTTAEHKQEYIYKYNKGVDGMVEPATQPPATDFSEIIRLWNCVSHTASITQIAEGTERYENVCKCLSLVGAGGITKAIEKVRDSEYLRNKKRVRFDNYINPNAIMKLLEGDYDEDYQKGGTDEHFGMFEAVGRRMDQLSGNKETGQSGSGNN